MTHAERNRRGRLIAERYAAGERLPVLAAEFGLSLSGVVSQVKRNGVPVRNDRGRPKHPNSDCPWCGAPAVASGMCRSCYERKRRGYSTPATPLGAATAERNAQIVKLVASGLTYGDVADRYGISRQRVHALCFQSGVSRPKTVLRTRKPMTPEQRREKTMRTMTDYLRKNVIVRGPEECWDWTGPTSGPYRYPHMRGFDPLDAPKARATYAYRIVYLLSRGPIPEGMTVDHLCFNPRCCNPAHLQLLTRAQNSARKSPAAREGCRARNRARKGIKIGPRKKIAA